MPPRFIRARNPEQKELRRAHLLETARRSLATGMDLRELGLNELARSAGVAKAGVYRYFESREAVFLALFWDEAAQWWTDLAPQLRARRSPDGVARLLARSLSRRPLLCALGAAMPSVLEVNLGPEAIRELKRRMLAFYAEAAAALARCCPALAQAAWVRVLHDGTTLIAGLYPSTHPSAIAARALETPDLAFFRRDFATELERLLRAVIAAAVAP